MRGWWWWRAYGLLMVARSSEARLVEARGRTRLVGVRGGTTGELGPWRGVPRTHHPPTSAWPNKGIQQRYRDNREHYKVEEIVKPLNDLLDRESRTVFIRRVYGLLGGSLGLTALSCLFCAGKPELVLQLVSQPLGRAGLGLAAALGLIVPLLLAFSPGLRHDPTKSVPLFATFSACEAALVGVLCTAYRQSTVSLAIVQTAVATLGLTAYGFQPNPKYDLTGFGSVLFSGLLVLTVSAFLGPLLRIQPMPLLMSTLGALLFSAFLVYDTQLIVGGEKRKAQLDTRDYVLGAIMLYLDVINLFIRILQLLDSSGGGSSDSDGPGFSFGD